MSSRFLSATAWEAVELITTGFYLRGLEAGLGEHMSGIPPETAFSICEHARGTFAATTAGQSRPQIITVVATKAP